MPTCLPRCCVLACHPRQVAKFQPLAGSPQPAFSAVSLAPGEVLNGRGYFKELPPDWVSEMVSCRAVQRGESKAGGMTRCLIRTAARFTKHFTSSTQEDAYGGDEDVLQQWRHVGLLLWPRSKRLLNAVSAAPALQTLRLHSMLVSCRLASRELCVLSIQAS